MIKDAEMENAKNWTIYFSALWRAVGMDPQESCVHVKQALQLAAISFPSQEQYYQSGAQ